MNAPSPRKHRVLVIGGGSIGERHVRCFRDTGRAEVSLCEVSDEVRNRVASEYDLPQAFAGLDDALSSGGAFDAAVVAVPAHLHVSFAARLAASGIHPFIEKPLGTNLSGVPDLLEKTGRMKAAMAFTYRSHPVFAAMREAVAVKQRFGRPIQVSVVAGQHFPLYRPAYREIYYARRETGGGLAQDMFPHLLNAVEWIAGPMTRVSADLSNRVLDTAEVDDTAAILARHGEVVATYSMNQHQAPNESVITVVCEGGTARFDYHGLHWSSSETPGAAWKVEMERELERDDIFVRQAESFLDYVEGKRETPLCSVLEGARTLAGVLATLRSSDRGGIPVEVPTIETKLS